MNMDLPRLHYCITLVSYCDQGHNAAAMSLPQLLLKRSEIRENAAGLFHITFLHISCILRWSEINLSVCGSWATPSLHISWVLRRSGVYVKRPGSAPTTSLHISCVLIRSGTTIINRDKSSKRLILFMSLDGPGEGQNTPWRGDFQIK